MSWKSSIPSRQPIAALSAGTGLRAIGLGNRTTLLCTLSGTRVDSRRTGQHALRALISERYHGVTKSILSKPFLRFIFCTEMNNNRARETNRRANVRAPSEKSTFSKQLAGFWRDLEDNQCWKYNELSLVQLLEKLKLAERLADKDELARAEFFWRRRPRLLSATGYMFWIIVALGLPAWLFVFPAIGAPLLIVSAVVVNAGIVRSVRWRRQYELSIDRLIRHFGRSAHSTHSV